MFALRGIVVWLAAFAVVYGATSIAVLPTWQKLSSYLQGLSAPRRADALFLLRVLPLISAALITAAFAVPSFLIFEPRLVQEQMGVALVSLSLIGLAVVIVGSGRAAAALTHVSRTIADWMPAAHGLRARALETPGSVSVLQVSPKAPPMTLAGVFRPRILLSEAVASRLSSSEFHAALNHELAHVRRKDNLRKLLLQFVAFPGMRGLEAAWLEAAEIAADDHAISNSREALDLASALIKLSRFAPLQPPVELTAALVHTPASLVDARVKRLLAWEARSPAGPKLPIARVVIVGGIMLSALAFSYVPLLVRVHALTEWLVR